MHVLIIPASYPKDKNDFSGSFFREQSLALLDRQVDVGVLYVNLVSLRNIYQYINIDKSYKELNDSGIRLFTKSAINLYPRNRYLQAVAWKYYGIKLFDKYISKYGLPDIIHVHSLFPGGKLAKYIKHTYKIPFIVTEHSSSYALSSPNTHIKSLNNLSNEASKRIAVSESFAQLLNTSMSSSQTNWDVLPNMVNDQYLTYKINTRPTSPFYFVSISNLSSNKNISLVLKSFSRYFRGSMHVRLRIGGNGTELNHMKELAKKLGISKQVEFLGYIKRNEVAKIMDESNVLIMSSNYETFGVVVIEALALGLPVIATKCGGPNNIVNSTNGILVNINNIDEMSNAMQSIFNNYSEYEPMRIRSECSKKYSSQVIIGQLINIYEKYKYE